MRNIWHEFGKAASGQKEWGDNLSYIHKQIDGFSQFKKGNVNINVL